MPHAFKTKKGEKEVGIAGVGGLGADGLGHILLEDAAKVMPELQEMDEHGRAVLDDDGNPKPLEGAALNKAAKEWGEPRGLEVVNLSKEEAEPVSSLREHSIRQWELKYKDLQPVNDDPEVLAGGGAPELSARVAPRRREEAK